MMRALPGAWNPSRWYAGAQAGSASDANTLAARCLKFHLTICAKHFRVPGAERRMTCAVSKEFLNEIARALFFVTASCNRVRAPFFRHAKYLSCAAIREAVGDQDSDCNHRAGPRSCLGTAQGYCRRTRC